MTHEGDRTPVTWPYHARLTDLASLAPSGSSATRTFDTKRLSGSIGRRRGISAGKSDSAARSGVSGPEPHLAEATSWAFAGAMGIFARYRYTLGARSRLTRPAFKRKESCSRQANICLGLTDTSMVGITRPVDVIGNVESNFSRGEERGLFVCRMEVGLSAYAGSTRAAKSCDNQVSG